MLVGRRGATCFKYMSWCKGEEERMLSAYREQMEEFYMVKGTGLCGERERMEVYYMYGEREMREECYAVKGKRWRNVKWGKGN